MGVTISTHNGSAVSREHNVRNKKVVAKQEHIGNGAHDVYEIWHDEKEIDAYRRLFDDAVQAYNAKQERADRQIKNYHAEVAKDAKKHTAYEMIISIGNRDNMIDERTGKEIMYEFYRTWHERNPNLVLIGAYYHNDELGVPHVHLDYIPVAHGYTRGMETQNGLVKALGEMGFEKHGRVTAQIQWEARENRYLEELCRERGLEVEHPLVEGREHVHTALYKAQQELGKAIDHTNDLDAINADLQAQNTILNQRLAEQVDRIARGAKVRKNKGHMVEVHESMIDHVREMRNEVREVLADQRYMDTETEVAYRKATEAQAKYEGYVRDAEGWILGTAQKLADRHVQLVLQGRPTDRESRMRDYMKTLQMPDGKTVWDAFCDHDKRLLAERSRNNPIRLTPDEKQSLSEWKDTVNRQRSGQTQRQSRHRSHDDGPER